MDAHEVQLAELQQTIENQRAVIALALETLEDLGFDLHELATATLS